MAFSSDHGGFEFSCADAKISMCVSTWSTRLSQIGRNSGSIHIITSLLPDHNYISQIIGKRPQNIFIIANIRAKAEAELLKNRFPEICIRLHDNINAKVVLVAPETVWVSSSDFGKTTQIESAIGLHSSVVYEKTLGTFFNKIWSEAKEVTSDS